MERDFRHTLNILENLRSANLGPSSIETVISGLQIGEQEKKVMSILSSRNNPPTSEANLRYCECLTTEKADYNGGWPYNSMPHTPTEKIYSN